MTTWSRLVFEEETLGIPGVHSFGQYNHLAAKPGLPPHRHVGCVEIGLLVKGHQAYQVGGKTYHVKGGEQYVALPNEMHDTGSEPQDKGILYWLLLDVTKYENEFLFLAPPMARKLIEDLLHVSSRHFVAAPDSHAMLERAFQALRKIRTPDQCIGIFQKNGRVKPSMVKDQKRDHTGCLKPSAAKSQKRDEAPADDAVHLLEAASAIVYYISQTLIASKTNARCISPVIKASLDFIAENEEVWHNVVHLADRANLSESNFKILFREEVGIPPAEYMLRQKIVLAKKRLRTRDCSITDVAYNLGFSSSQYFAAVFKRFTNQTPSDFVTGQRLELIDLKFN